jgi:hypothetical protein
MKKISGAFPRQGIAPHKAEYGSMDLLHHIAPDFKQFELDYIAGAVFRNKRDVRVG